MAASDRQIALLNSLVLERNLDKEQILADVSVFFNREILDWEDSACSKEDASNTIEYILEEI